MSDAPLRQEINFTLLSGTVASDPDVRRSGPHRHPIVSFDGETVQTVGKNNRIEVLKWRAKLFGAMAEKAVTQLRKGLRITIEGGYSGYEPPDRKKNAKPEITVRRFWLDHPIEVGVAVELTENTPEERQKQLEADLHS